MRSPIGDADRAGKSWILDESVELTAITALQNALTLKIVKPRRGRAPASGLRVTVVQTKCWAVLRAPAGTRGQASGANADPDGAHDRRHH